MTFFHPHRLSVPALAAIFLAALSSPSLAKPDNRDVVRTQTGRVVVNTFQNCVRTKWISGDDVCGMPAPAPRAEAPASKVAIQQVSQEERTVYFGFNKATLSAQARERLNSLAEKLKSDAQVKQARIVGYADRIGNPSYNEMLSKRRATNVRNYLVGRGFINARVADTRWRGESSPSTHCPDTLSRARLIECLQKDRKVEVEIDYYPQEQQEQQGR